MMWSGVEGMGWGWIGLGLLAGRAAKCRHAPLTS
jgi:hypothetical protein